MIMMMSLGELKGREEVSICSNNNLTHNRIDRDCFTGSVRISLYTTTAITLKERRTTPIMPNAWTVLLLRPHLP
jgi:hypothetical protein